MNLPEPEFYGAITVSDRGQVVIPAKARKDLDIHEGDKLLVLSSPFQGVMLVKSEVLTERVGQMQSIFKRMLEESDEPDHEAEEGGDE